MWHSALGHDYGSNLILKEYKKINPKKIRILPSMRFEYYLTLLKNSKIDEELKFKVEARANKYIGEWAAKVLGINSEEKKQNYIQEVIKSDLLEAGKEDVFRKIQKDFKAASITMDDKSIRDIMQKSLENAKKDFKK